MRCLAALVRLVGPLCFVEPDHLKSVPVPVLLYSLTQARCLRRGRVEPLWKTTLWTPYSAAVGSRRVWQLGLFDESLGLVYG